MATTTRSPASQHWTYFLNGVEQAFNWPKTFILFYSSSTIQSSMIKAFVVNGVLFFGTVLFLETFYNLPHHRILGCSYASLFGYPMYIILLGLNGKFFTPVAEKSFQIQAKNNPRAANANTNLVQSMAATIYTVIFYINCSVFSSLIRAFIPSLGTILAFFMNCAIMGYYCFEYKWLYFGWTLERRLSYLEQHWAYFLGFGFPLSVLTFFLPTLYSGALFSIIYPCYVIMAMMATPKPSTPYGQPLPSGNASSYDVALPNRIPIFLGVRKLNDLVILLVRLLGGVHADAIVSEKTKMAKME